MTPPPQGKNSLASVASLSDVLSLAGPRPPEVRGSTYATRFGKWMSTYIANGLRDRFPGITPGPKGERAEFPSRAVRGLKRLNVNYSTAQAGLGFGISLKSVHVSEKKHRFIQNMKRNDEELRVEAAGYHQRQPYAVMVAVIVLPYASCDDPRVPSLEPMKDKKDASSFGNWVDYMRPLAGRVSPTDDFTKYELVFILLYDPDGASLEFFSVLDDPPSRGRPQNTHSLDSFLDIVDRTYHARNEIDFRWADDHESS